MGKDRKIAIAIIVLLVILIILVSVTIVLLVANRTDESTMPNLNSGNNETGVKNETTVKNEVLVQNQKVTDNNNVLSSEEAIVLAKDMYKKITEYYWMGGDISQTINVENENPYELMTWYDELKDFLTNNYFKKFTERRTIINRNGKYYINQVSWGEPPAYLGYDSFEVKSITNKKIEFIVKEKYIVNADDLDKDVSEVTEFEYENNPFILVKENGKWKVDEWVHP